MRPVVLTLAVLATLGLAGAAAVVGLGLYNVSARAGHFPGVSWVLHTTFRNSVRLRAPSMEEAPDLDDPDLIALGAGHYASACAMCHATPGSARSATARAMVPAPPPIEAAVADWRPNELHWIVENGIKMSGMPGWPTGDRGDEVWAVVAWLVSVKAGRVAPVPAADLDGGAYCQSCHGSVAGPVPRLDILQPGYTAAQLRAYLAGERASGIMAQAASVVPPDRFDDLAAELSRGLSVELAQGDGRGAELARRGTRDVPACLACHGGEASKGPALAGQPEVYLAGQLRLWREGVHDHNALMQAAARDLTDDDIAALAAYFAGAR